MKVGIYSLSRCLKSKNIVALGERPIMSILLQLLLLIGLTGFITMFAVTNYPVKAWAPLILLFLLYALFFLKLCLMEPGIPPDIL